MGSKKLTASPRWPTWMWLIVLLGTCYAVFFVVQKFHAIEWAFWRRDEQNFLRQVSTGLQSYFLEFKSFPQGDIHSLVNAGILSGSRVDYEDPKAGHIRRIYCAVPPNIEDDDLILLISRYSRENEIGWCYYITMDGDVMIARPDEVGQKLKRDSERRQTLGIGECWKQ